MDEHIQFMHRCFQLAAHGRYTARPNPVVGAVLVYQGRIIGEGWHHMPGEPHAEVMAIRSVKDEIFLTKSTLYVNLEPCSHYGRTPPCALLIIDKKIPKVVVSNLDPNPLVSGRGVHMLQSHQTEVITRVEEARGWDLNRYFFTYHTLKRPFIHLKWAESADGFLAPSSESSGQPILVSSPQSLRLAHQLRASIQAILIGSKTATVDNPSLTTRRVDGPNPLRFVIDRRRKLPESLKIFQSDTPAIRIVDLRYAQKEDIALRMTDDWDWLNALMDELYLRNIQSLQVEGGALVLNGFISQGLWDEAWMIKSLMHFGGGVKGPAKDVIWPFYSHNFQSDTDTIFVFRNLRFPK